MSGEDHAAFVSADHTPAARSTAGRPGMEGIDPQQLTHRLKAFAKARPWRSAWELAVTAVPFGLLCGVMLAEVDAGHFQALLLTAPAGFFLLRLFLIQHDCGHGAFFPSRPANDLLGRMLGVLTFTPYDCWRRSHALHHAGTGNLDARGFGDVDTLTVREFQARCRWGQLRYRLYRHPLVLLGIGPAYLFLVRHRLPIGLMKAGSRYWMSAMGTNVATALILGGLVYWYGIWSVSLVVGPVLLIAASTGVWLFYVQHQFERAHWDVSENWSFHEAALHGSSHLELPPLLRWFTANIGAHHVHHLASRIPFYRLPEVLSEYPQLARINHFTPMQTIGALGLTLWDEKRRQLVPFG